MNRDDFNLWIGHHAALFAGFQDFILGMQPYCDQNTADLRQEAWLSEFNRFPLVTAKAASSKLVKLPEDQRPKVFKNDYSGHFEAMLRMMRLCGSSETTRQGRYARRCMCGETGLVYAVMRVGTRLKPNGMPVESEYLSVACLCPLGQELMSVQHARFSQFDRETMVTLDQFRREWYEAKQREAVA